MHISIFGLGYVGAVCAGCLSARGHDVVGVDISSAKIDLINKGKSPIVEPGLGELLQQRYQDRQTARHDGLFRSHPRHRSVDDLRRHAKQEKRRSGTGLHRVRLPRDRFRAA